MFRDNPSKHSSVKKGKQVIMDDEDSSVGSEENHSNEITTDMKRKSTCSLFQAPPSDVSDQKRKKLVRLKSHPEKNKPKTNAEYKPHFQLESPEMKVIEMDKALEILCLALKNLFNQVSNQEWSCIVLWIADSLLYKWDADRVNSIGPAYDELNSVKLAYVYCIYEIAIKLQNDEAIIKQDSLYVKQIPEKSNRLLKDIPMYKKTIDQARFNTVEYLRNVNINDNNSVTEFFKGFFQDFVTKWLPRIYDTDVKRNEFVHYLFEELVEKQNISAVAKKIFEGAITKLKEICPDSEKEDSNNNNNSPSNSNSLMQHIII